MSIVAYRKPRPSAPAYAGGLTDFDRLFDNLFKNAFTNLADGGTSVTALPVHMDVSETDKAYLIHAELPGMDRKDVEITLDDGLLTLAGEKQQETAEDGKTFHRTERRYGSFKRTLTLPADADENAIKAVMKNGVLRLEIGKVKTPEKQARRIDIQTT